MANQLFDEHEHLLLKAVHDRETAALDYLFRKHYPYLLKSAQKKIKDPAIASDLVSDGFLKLWESKAIFANRAAIRSFLYTTTERLCTDYWRSHDSRTKKLRKYAAEQNNEEEPVPLPELLDDPRMQQLVAGLRASLPARARQVWDYLYKDGLDNRAIAQLLHVHVRTVQREEAFIRTLLRSRPFQRQVEAIRGAIHP